jgi:lipid-A-disaccharide synthase
MKKILIVAGEASGDMHAAELIKKATAQSPGLYFYGIGGDRMRDAHAELLVHNKSLNVMGIIELVKHLPKIRTIFNKIRNILVNDPPDLLILVDFPEFNLRLAKIAKKNNVKVLYYISPQLWAWRKGRIKHIQKYIDKMAVILPFEVDFYKSHQVEAVYVGNPLATHVMPSLSIPATRHKYRIYNNKITIGLLPGSRKNEVKYIFPTILKAAELLIKKYPNTQFILPLAPTVSEQELKPYLNQYNLPIKFITNDTYNVVQLCDAVICVSGTASLEMALLGIPMVIIYKLAFISALVGFLLVNLEHVGLCNIIAGEMIAKELIQYKATAKNIMDEISKILENKKYTANMRVNYKLMRSKLLANQEQKNIGQVVVEMLN